MVSVEGKAVEADVDKDDVKGGRLGVGDRREPDVGIAVARLRLGLAALPLAMPPTSSACDGALVSAGG